MKLINFTPNVPQELRLGSDTSPEKLIQGAGCLYTLSDGRLLHLPGSVSQDMACLSLGPGESFHVCQHQKGGGLPYWSVWLSNETEKRRAAAEAPELEQQLAESIALVARRRSAGIDRGAAVPLLAPTGTEGPAPQLAPRKPAIAAVAGDRRGKPGPIPANIAFSEILQFTQAQLRESKVT